MFLRLQILCFFLFSCFFLGVTPGSQEHDSPYGILGGGAAAVGATALATTGGGGGRAAFAGRPRSRRGVGAAGSPQFVTEGLFDLVSPGAPLPCRELRGFHHGHGCCCCCPALPRSPNTARHNRLGWPTEGCLQSRAEKW
jgi:hypothetical protein